MSPTKKFSVWLTAIALLVAMVLTPIAAGAKPPVSKVWNIYQDKLGAYTVTSSAPKGQTLIEGPFATQAAATAALTQPPVIEFTLDPVAPNGANGWYSSGNVSLTWNVFVPGSPGKSLVVTGDTNQTVSTDGVFTFTKSATAVGGSAGPVDVTIMRDATPPVLNVASGISNGDSFFVGGVPPEPTFNPQDATSGLDTSSLTGYGATVGTHTVVATATDLAGNVITEQIGYTVALKPANVVEPTKVDQQFSGTPGLAIPGGLNIPTVEGIDYSVDGNLVVGGFIEKAPGIYQVTAVAQPDYVLVGYTGPWTLEVLAADVTVHVTPGIPTATDEVVNALGFITIPGTTGVNYLIDGNLVSAGDNPLPAGNHLVTAEAQPFYILDGATSWPLTINAFVPPDIEVVAAAPTATDPTANASGFITIPSVTGVEYSIDGVAVAAGTFDKAPGLYSVTAAALPGYALLAGSQSQWPLTINAYVPPLTHVTPLAPTAVDQTANAQGHIEIPVVAGVDYFIDGVAAFGIVEMAPGIYQVTAAPQAGYALDGQTAWSLTINPYAAPKQIEFVGRTGGDLGGSALTLPAGWQPGDLAVAFVARNTGGATSVPPLPAGWTSPAVGGTGYTSTTYPYSAYRLMYRVLQPGDTTWTLTMSYRAAGVMVYRNASFGAASGYASRSTAAIPLLIPALTLQTPGTSWVGGFGYMDNTVVRDKPPVSPLTVNRMNGAVPGSSMLGGWDTAGGVSTFPNTTIFSGYYTATAAASFELKLVP
jgi:hypothetical protein